MVQFRYFILIPAILLSAIWIVGQEKKAVNGQDGATPVAPENAKQRYDKLRKPSFAQLKLGRKPLELNESAEKLKEHYKAGDRISFNLSITNTSNEEVAIPVADAYYFSRTKLFRGGDLVPYRKDIASLVKAKDKDLTSIRVRPAHLEPNESVAVSIDLSDWYESLEPGHYQLVVQWRFIIDGEWIESPPLTFEVDPKYVGAAK